MSIIGTFVIWCFIIDSLDLYCFLKIFMLVRIFFGRLDLQFEKFKINESE